MWRRALDALAPVLCAGCGVPAPAVLCEACVEHLLALPVPAPLRLGRTGCRAALPWDEVVRRTLHRAKYRGCARAMHLLGAVGAERLAPALRDGPRPAAVVPVPLGTGRRRRRGYNQAEVAARALAAAGGIPVLLGLRRIRETAPQVGRDGAARRANLVGAFAWSGQPAAGAVWLVDDVVTTGATLDAAVEALQRAGTRRIEAVALAVSARSPGREYATHRGGFAPTRPPRTPDRDRRLWRADRWWTP